jgi:hypothetical protein
MADCELIINWCRCRQTFGIYIAYNGNNSLSRDERDITAAAGENF